MQGCVWMSWTPHVAGGDGPSPCTHPGAGLLGGGGRGSLLLCALSPRALWGLPKVGGLPSLLECCSGQGEGRLLGVPRLQLVMDVTGPRSTAWRAGSEEPAQGCWPRRRWDVGKVAGGPRCTHACIC